MIKFDVVIAGAGIVGLSTAYKLKEKNPNLKICIIEKEDAVSKHQTGNNSGVIHSGIYYKPGSLKAINCIRGYKMLLEFCNQNNVKYEICGKIIIAVKESEMPSLETLYERGIENGLIGLKKLNENELNEYEPYARGIGGIYVPQTGIIDFKEVSEKIEMLLKNKNVEFKFEEELIKISEDRNGVHSVTNRESYLSERLITCCGLQSDRVAGLNNKNLDIRIIPFRGEYYKIKKSKSYIVKNLIYPVPDPRFPFLGVHYTRKISGEIEAGPNAVFSFKREGYGKFDIDFKDTIDSIFWKGFTGIMRKYWKTGLAEFYRSFSKTAFTKALQNLTPLIEKSDLEEGGAGIRAQACGKDGKLIDDFLFVGNERVLHVCNAPSPAATSCFSIGDTIAEKILNKN